MCVEAVLASSLLELREPANGGEGSQARVSIEKFTICDGVGVGVGNAHPITYLRAQVESELPIEPSRVSEPKNERPVVFVFNGGPGVSSVWLHLGGVGPLRVAVPEDLDAPGQSSLPLIENPGSLFGVADLVF